MRPYQTPRLTEKERLNKFLASAKRLSRFEKLSENNKYVMRLHLRAVLKILGAKYPNKFMIANGLMILRDYIPFKKWRLKKLIARLERPASLPDGKRD